MSFITAKIPGIFFLLPVVILLSSCAEMPGQANKMAAARKIARLSFLSITIPPHWQRSDKETLKTIDPAAVQREESDTNQIVITAQDKKANVTISSKKIVTPPDSTSSDVLIKAYGRIGIKQILKEGGREEGFTDNLTIAGQAAVQYFIKQGARFEMINFVRYLNKLFVITVTAPREKLGEINELILKNIDFGNKPANPATLIHSIDYEISPHITGLHFGDLQSQQINFKNNNKRTKNVSEQIKKYEQICFVTALLRSEGLDIMQDRVHLQSLLNSVRKLYIKNKTVIPIARCYALVLFLENKFSESSVLFNKIIRNYPEDIYAKLYLIMIRPYAFADTRIMLEKVLTDDPGNVLAGYLQIKMLLAQGKKREGIGKLKKILRKHPENVWLNYTLVRNANDDTAIKPNKIKITYKKILEEIPSFAGARFNLALFYFKNKQYDNSLKHLNIILTRYPNDTASYILKGLIYKIQNKYLLAKNQFEFALSLEPENFKALYNLGALCAAKLNDTLCARQAFMQYLHVAPQNDRNGAVSSWLHEN